MFHVRLLLLGVLFTYIERVYLPSRQYTSLPSPFDLRTSCISESCPYCIPLFNYSRDGLSPIPGQLQTIVLNHNLYYKDVLIKYLEMIGLHLTPIGI